jgi:hypothetical protein
MDTRSLYSGQAIRGCWSSRRVRLSELPYRDQAARSNLLTEQEIVSPKTDDGYIGVRNDIFREGLHIVFLHAFAQPTGNCILSGRI